MKKLFAIILLCALILSGCATEDTPTDPPANGGSDGSVQASAPAGALCRINENRSGLKLSANSKGAYEMHNVGHQDGFLMTYTDFETAAVRPLCGIAGCAHDSADCEARKRPEIDGAELHCLAASEEKLFWFFMPATDYVTFTQSGASAVYVSELDGSGRRPLVIAEGNAEITGNIVFCDGRYIYYQQMGHEILQTEEGAKTVFTGGIMKTDIATGESELLLARDGESPQWNLVGQLDEARLLVIESRMGELQPGAGKEGPDTEFFTLIAVSTSGETETLGEWSIKSVFSPLSAGTVDETSSLGFKPQFLANGRYYGVKKEGENLVELDLATFSVRELCAKPAGFGESRYEVSGMWDGRLLLASYDTEQPMLYAYNLADGSLAELTQTYYKNGGGYLSIAPYAETENEFYLPVGERVVELFSVSGGSPMTETAALTQYAMTAKADYWSNTPNYRDITEEN